MTNQNVRDSHSRWEIFYDEDDAPIGLLYRRWSSRELLTDIIFASPERHRITCRIELEGRRWVRSRYIEDGAEPVVVEAVELIEEEDAIPTDMEYFLLNDAIANASADDEHTVSYHVFAPNDRHAIAQDASIWSPQDGIWEIEANGELASSHTVVDGEIVSSDWRGVRSRPVPARQAVDQLRGIVDDDVLDTLLATDPVD
ncbi:hypothetical protein VR010_14530 [Actinomycetaceae bacterium L2_0104]